MPGWLVFLTGFMLGAALEMITADIERAREQRKRIDVTTAADKGRKWVFFD